MKPYVTDTSYATAGVRTDQSDCGDVGAAAVVGTLILGTIVKVVVGLRPSEETESVGLDLAEHGEEGYHGEA